MNEPLLSPKTGSWILPSIRFNGSSDLKLSSEIVIIEKLLIESLLIMILSDGSCISRPIIFGSLQEKSIIPNTKNKDFFNLVIIISQKVQVLLY